MDDHFGDSHGDTSLNNAWLSYEEVRTGVGAEWKINSSLSLTIEGGYVPWRQFDFHRTEVRYHQRERRALRSDHAARRLLNDPGMRKHVPPEGHASARPGS